MKDFRSMLGAGADSVEISQTRDAIRAALEQVANELNTNQSFRDQMIGDLGPINAALGIRTEDGSIMFTVVVDDGACSIALDECADEADARLVFRSVQAIEQYVSASPDDAIRMFLSSHVRLEGNPAAFGYVNYLVSLTSWEADLKAMQEQAAVHHEENRELAANAGPASPLMRQERIAAKLTAERVDPGVRWLDEPYLSNYSLPDFPRLERFRREHRETMPEVTAEQGKLLTDFHVANGFATKPDGTPWDPMLRTGKAFEYLMERRQPIIHDGDLLAGTITPNPICGSINQPYTVGWSIWGEMKTLRQRELDPFDISDENRDTLHKYVFPYWMDKHLQQVWKVDNDYPLAAQINDRLFCFNFWSLVSLNPGSPGFEQVVHTGLDSQRTQILDKLASSGDASQEQRDSWEGMLASIDGMLAYTEHLAALSGEQAAAETDPTRRRELLQMQSSLQRVPRHPATTLHEAVQCLWIMFIGVCLDSMDDDITIGRLDRILQPYFDADLSKLPIQERDGYIRDAIELVGCLFLRFTSHRLAAATVASWQNSGAPGVASVTVGGVAPDGGDAVSDMTYIVLKVAEMLCLDDPDMDARYQVGVNSTEYIRRVAELNYLTSGTPSIHNDAALVETLCQHGWDVEDARDWVPCGCVEPVIHGKHFAAPGDLDSNLMVPLTMAIYNGYHPTADWAFGPKTGEVDTFDNFEEFMTAFETQFRFIYEHAIDASHQLLAVQQQLMPAPLYSTMLVGCIESGRGMTHGGAKYNSSGAAFIALSDVVDSLLVIKEIVFDERLISFGTLRDAMDADFVGYETLHATIENTVPKFGSGDPTGRAMVDRVTRMIADFLHHQDNARGGHYSVGYRTNNNHTVYGRVSGASPSGRKAGTPFTSGLTPNPAASTNLLDNLNDVASIDPLSCDNNYTLNVRLSFANKADHRQNVDRIANYVQAYFINGGMQIQFNMVDTDTLKDAMARPQLYPDLIARVSGYTGYFTRMQRDLQLEIIGRTEFIV